MKLVSAVLVFVLAVLTVAQKPLRYDLYNSEELFEKFIKDYNRHYKSQIDKEDHYNAFVTALVIINKANDMSKSARFDVNDFADYTPTERKKLMGLDGRINWKEMKLPLNKL